jgi:hypothetical protein
VHLPTRLSPASLCHPVKAFFRSALSGQIDWERGSLPWLLGSPEFNSVHSSLQKYVKNFVYQTGLQELDEPLRGITAACKNVTQVMLQ